MSVMHLGCRLGGDETKWKLSRDSYARITDASRRNSGSQTPLHLYGGMDADSAISAFWKVQGCALAQQYKEQNENYALFMRFVEMHPKALLPYLTGYKRAKRDAYTDWLFQQREEHGMSGEEAETLFFQHEAELKKLTIEDMLADRYLMPYPMQCWYLLTGSEAMTDSDIKEFVLNYTRYSPYHTMSWSERQQEKALYNFDVNMERFAQLSRVSFRSALQNFLAKWHLPFQKADSLLQVDSVTGLYIMVLGEYSQVYIGQTAAKSGIKGRIQQHWRTEKPLDSLLFGSQDDSILSIDSFGALDTTEIYYCPVPASRQQITYLKQEEKRLVSYAMPSQYVINRCAGGCSSLSESFRTKRTIASLIQ